MVVAKLGREFETGAKECRSKLGNKLLHRIAVVAKALLAKASV
jgi:hypothetical protein